MFSKLKNLRAKVLYKYVNNHEVLLQNILFIPKSEKGEPSYNVNIVSAFPEYYLHHINIWFYNNFLVENEFYLFCVCHD